IAYLATLNSDQFANALADCIMSPEAEWDDALPDAPKPIPKVAAERAFRSPRFVEQSIAAADLLLKQARNRTLAKGADNDRDWRRRQQFYMDKVGRERKVLGAVLKGLKAQAGYVDNAPSPRGRAMQRLWQLNLAGDVPRGKAIEL